MRYNRTFRATMLKKLLHPGGPSLGRLSDETGVTKTTLYRWLRDAKSGQMKPEELGAWLRTQGVTGEELKLWEKQIREALESASDRTRERESEKEIKVLKKELTRKEQALAELSALLVLKKKVHAVLGDAE